MERETGIEPVTSSLGSWRSTAELLPLNFVRLPFRSSQDNAPYRRFLRLPFCRTARKIPALDLHPHSSHVAGALMSADSLPPKYSSRRNLLRPRANAPLVAAAYPAPGSARVVDSEPAPAPAVSHFEREFELDEVTIDDLQKAFQSGQYSSRSLTEKYLARIQEIDKTGPMLNSVIELNPDALQIADALDQERTSKGPRGPLHGIPVLIKDNIDTGDRVNTTAGSRGRAGAPPPARRVLL